MACAILHVGVVCRVVLCGVPKCTESEIFGRNPDTHLPQKDEPSTGRTHRYIALNFSVATLCNVIGTTHNMGSFMISWEADTDLTPCRATRSTEH